MEGQGDENDGDDGYVYVWTIKYALKIAVTSRACDLIFILSNILSSRPRSRLARSESCGDHDPCWVCYELLEATISIFDTPAKLHKLTIGLHYINVSSSISFWA